MSRVRIGRRQPEPPAADAAAAALLTLARVAERVAAGDLEARVPDLGPLPAAAAAIGVLESVTGALREMSGLVDGVAAATEREDRGDGPGLGRLAEDLRGEVLGLVATVRGAV
nr:hypothetical protein GCM10020063_023460 [Dactylosporangium thailandense]